MNSATVKLIVADATRHYAAAQEPSFVRNRRAWVVEQLASGSKTPFTLFGSLNEQDRSELASIVVDLEATKQIYIHRDTSHDKRHGGMSLPDGSSATLFASRPPEASVLGACGRCGETESLTVGYCDRCLAGVWR